MRWWRQESPFGTVTVVTGERGLLRITLPLPSQPPARPPFDGPPFDGPQSRDAAVAGQLDEWFAGTREAVSVPVDLETAGVRSAFRRTVLETLRAEVPYGETVTYGELAVMAGRPGAARAVGTAMRTNPIAFVIPCHRVVASGGIGGYGGGAEGIALKRALLAHEARHRRLTRVQAD